MGLDEKSTIVSCPGCRKKFRIKKKIRFQCKYCSTLIDPNAQLSPEDSGVVLSKALKATQDELFVSSQDMNKKFLIQFFRRPAHLLKKFAYWYDNFISKGAIAMFLTLMCLFLITLCVCFSLYVITGNATEIGNRLWVTVRQICDPGSLSEANDSSITVKVLAFCTTMLGMSIFSLLIAFLTNIFDQKLQELKKGYSMVLEENHTLILGWSDKVMAILTELIMANECRSRGVAVILSTKSKEELEEYLRVSLKQRMSTDIIIRSGEVSNLANLEKVGISRCKSVIIVSEASKGANRSEIAINDTQIVKTILSICKNPARRPESFNIVTEIGDPKNIDIARSIGEDEITILYSNEIIARILVQTSRQNGLANVYNEILSFAGNEIYCVEEPKTHHKKFHEILCNFPNCVPIGLKQQGKNAQINPPHDTVIVPGDQIILVAEDENTIGYKEMEMESTKFSLPRRKELEPRKERQLLLGWNAKTENVIREYGNYLSKGSEIDVVLPDPTPEIQKTIQRLGARLADIRVGLIHTDYRLRDELAKIKPFSYDNIIILAWHANEEASIEEVDSQTIYTLLLLRDMQRKIEGKESQSKLITEILNPANQELIQIAKVNDFIISNQLISMMLAQISEQKTIYEVYYDLFRAEGSEIYLKSAHVYFERLPVEVDFYDILGVVTQRGEVPFGYRIHKWANRSDLNFGIKLNPCKDKKILLDNDDQIIVVAENEF